LRLRMKTSHKGVFGVVIDDLPDFYSAASAA
jgi:hypothetical protein